MNIMSVKRIKISLVDRSSGVPGVFQKRKCLRITIQAIEKATGYSLSMEKETSFVLSNQMGGTILCLASDGRGFCDVWVCSEDVNYKTLAHPTTS